MGYYSDREVASSGCFLFSSSTSAMVKGGQGVEKGNYWGSIQPPPPILVEVVINIEQGIYHDDFFGFFGSRWPK